MSQELTLRLIKAIEEYIKLEKIKLELSIHRSRANPEEDNELRGHLNAGQDKDKQNILFEFENEILNK